MGSASQPGQSGTSFCFRVQQERSGWSILHPVPSKTTVDLAALVCGAPEFLGMGDGAAPCQAAVVLSERGDARVVAALDETGGLTLVGCPAQLTRGALTTVVQELLVFTGRLWRMPPEELSAVFEKRLGQSLTDYFSNRSDIGWSESGFRSGLGRSLARGRFPVVLLLTGANLEVGEAIAHLKSHNLDVKPLGIEFYESSGVEIVVPRVLEVAEPGPHEDKEPAKLVPRPTPPQPLTPPRSKPSAADFASVGVSEPATQSRLAPARKMPWSDQPVPRAAVTEPESVEQAVDTGAPVSAPPSEPAPFGEMPWSDQPVPRAAVTEPESVEQAVDTGAPVSAPPPEPAPFRNVPWSDQPVPGEPKPVAASPQLAPKAAPAGRPVWDGTMPGVMAGRRPPRKAPEGSATHKANEQAKNERHWR